MRKNKNAGGKRPHMRIFKCPNCNAITPAPKYMGKTKAGHIKTMRCYKCMKEVDLIQIE